MAIFPNVSVRRKYAGRNVIRGYAAVYFREDDPGTEYRLRDGTFERFLPPAFEGVTRQVASVDCRLNHEHYLASTRDATLKLETDGRGLWFEAWPDETQQNIDLVIEPIRRGDIRMCSIKFWSRDEKVRSEWRGGRWIKIREIRDLLLDDVGPASPSGCYRATSVWIEDPHEIKASFVADGADEDDPFLAPSYSWNERHSVMLEHTGVQRDRATVVENSLAVHRNMIDRVNADLERSRYRSGDARAVEERFAKIKLREIGESMKVLEKMA